MEAKCIGLMREENEDPAPRRQVENLLAQTNLLLAHLVD